MAYFSDPYNILCYVRKVFIEHDDSGLCAEIVGDKLPSRKKLFPDLPGSYESDKEEESSSPEEFSDWEYDKVENGKLKFDINIPEGRDPWDSEDDQWADEDPDVYTGWDPEVMFARQEVGKNKRAGRSLLSYQLEQRSVSSGNPFVDYSKYEGSYELKAATKKFKIFLTMLPHEERDYPLSVCVLSSATVMDFVGLVCFKYTAENPNGSFKLKEDVNEYCLFIADEKGEVDWEFPSLDPYVKIGKFCLQYLALVEVSNVNIPKEVIAEKALVPPKEEPVEDEATKQAELEALERFMEDLRKMASLIYETFEVKMIQKRKKVKVILGISLDKVEVQANPEYRRRGKSLPKGVKLPLDYDARDIVASELLKKKSNNKTKFRIINHEEDFFRNVTYNNNDFECDTETADKILDKLDIVLEARSSSLRKEYLENLGKEKKTKISRIFSFWCR